MRLALTLVVAAGCGTGDAGITPDGGTGADAAAGTTLVRVVDDGDPVAGARVVFQRPDGSVDRVVIADSRGVAAAPIARGGMVTVAYPNQIALTTSRVQLLTVADLVPDGELTVEIPRFGPTYDPPDLGPVAGRLELALPPLDGLGYVVVHLGCTDHMTDAAAPIIDVPRACVRTDGRVDLTVEAFSAPDLPARLGTTYAAGVDLAGNAPTPVALPAWTTADPTIDVELTDLPTGATNAFAIAVMVAGGRAYQPVLADSAGLDGDAVTLSPGFYTGFAEAMDLESRLTTGGPGELSSLFLLGAQVEPVTRLSATGFLPLIRDARPDPAARVLQWTADGSVATADALFLHLQSERPDGVVTRYYRWTVLAAPDRGARFALPDLPAELADYRPQPADDYLEAGVVALDVDWVAGPDAFVRDHGFRFLDEPCVPVHTTARVSRSGLFYGPRLLTGAY
jgi:hypothetical protein